MGGSYAQWWATQGTDEERSKLAMLTPQGEASPRYRSRIIKTQTSGHTLKRGAGLMHLLVKDKPRKVKVN